MNLDRVGSGSNPPEDINVIVEIPLRGEPVKYEVDKDTGAMFVDRFLNTAMHYPCNYGYVPHTIAGDGDPVDVLVVTGIPLIVGSVIRVRPVGMLKMVDEAGEDAKVLGVPINKLSGMYQHVEKPEDFPVEVTERIAHFFEHYKDLEKNKWVRIEGWAGPEAAHQEILDGINNFQSAVDKPHF